MISSIAINQHLVQHSLEKNFDRVAELARTRVRVCKWGSSSWKYGSRSSMRISRLVSCAKSPWWPSVQVSNWSQSKRSNCLAAARSLLHFLQVHGIPRQTWWAAPKVRSLNLRSRHNQTGLKMEYTTSKVFKKDETKHLEQSSIASWLLMRYWRPFGVCWTWKPFGLGKIEITF